MRLDPRVAAAKFDQEVARLRRQESTLRQWGCWIARVERPEIDVVFVPRLPLKFQLPVPIPRNKNRVDVALAAGDVPLLAARAFGVRLELTDFDLVPPSVTFRDPWTWELLKFDDLPRPQLVAEATKQLMNVMLDAHPRTKLPFICIRGVREYHDHAQHSGDDWMLYRSSTSVFTILHRLWRLCIAELVPRMAMAPAPGGVQLQVAWLVESKTP